MADRVQVHNRMPEVSGEEWKATGENRPWWGLERICSCSDGIRAHINWTSQGSSSDVWPL